MRMCSLCLLTWHACRLVALLSSLDAAIGGENSATRMQRKKLTVVMATALDTWKAETKKTKQVKNVRTDDVDDVKPVAGVAHT